MKYGFLLFIILMVTVSCKTSAKGERGVPASQPVAGDVKSVGGMMALPKVVIYKTVGDYDNLVPIGMNDTKTAITSYPDPLDVRGAKPVRLVDGYLLDNRGIGVNSVFTDYTYDEYAALPMVPLGKELKAHVKYTDPIAEMYIVPDNGEATKNPEYLNGLIKSGFKNCKRLK